MKFSLWTFSVYFSILADGVWEQTVEWRLAFVNKIIDGLWALSLFISLSLSLSVSLSLSPSIQPTFSISLHPAAMEIHLLSYIIYWNACICTIILFVSMRACKMCVYMYICIYFSCDFSSTFTCFSSYLMLACLLSCVHACVRVRSPLDISVYICIYDERYLGYESIANTRPNKPFYGPQHGWEIVIIFKNEIFVLFYGHSVLFSCALTKQRYTKLLKSLWYIKTETKMMIAANILRTQTHSHLRVCRYIYI